MAAPVTEEEDFTSLLSSYLAVPSELLTQISSDNERVKEVLCKAKERFEEQASKEHRLRSDMVILRRARVNAEQQFSQVEKRLISCNTKLDVESRQCEKFRKELEETVTTLDEKQRRLREVQSMKENSSANYSRVSNLNAQLEAEKLELLTVVERKNQEIDRLNDEWKSMSNKLTSANSLRCEAQAKLDEIESQETHFKFREKRIEQEQVLMQKQVNWLNGELKNKTDELTSLRKEKSTQVLELQGQLDERNEEASHLRNSTETIKKRNAELEAKVESLMERLKDARDQLSKVEERYKLELASQTKLARIYKDSAEESENKGKELLTAVEELERLLKEANESKHESLSRMEEQENSHKKTAKEFEEKIKKLEAEVENANDLLSAARQRGLAPMTEAALSSLSPTAAATSSLLKSGMTLTQIYSQYVEVSDLLQQEKDENVRLKQYMDQILKEIEEKAPMLQQQRQDYEQALRSVDQLSRRLDTSLVESEEFRRQADEAKKHSEHVRREIQRMRIANADLSQQVQLLLKECEEARGGIVTPESSSVPMSSAEVSSSSHVISQHLVTFRSIEELQQQNQKLLAVVRDLSEDKEKKENDGPSEIVSELKKQLEATVQEVQDMKEGRERQMQVVEAVVRQRDMYRVLLENNGQSPIPVGDPSLLLGSSLQPRTPSKVDGEAEDTKIALRELQKNFEEYRSNKTKNEEVLNDKLEKSNSLNVELQGQNAKLSSQLEFENERYTMLSSNAEGFKKEAAAVTEKSQKLTLAAHKLQMSLDSVSQDLAATREKLRKAEVSCETLQAEKNLVKETEIRLLQENKSLLEQQKGQNVLLTNLQSLQNNLERSEFETRSKLGAQVEALKREATLLRKKLESEENHHRTVVKTWENRVQELRNQLQMEIKTHQEAREKLISASNELENLNAKHSQASAHLQATEKRVDELLKEPETTQQDLERAKKEVEDKYSVKLQEVHMQLTESGSRANLLEEQLKKAKQHVEQFKSMSAANEEALKDLNKVSEEYKKSIEERLARAEEEASKLKTQVGELDDSNRRLLQEKTKLQNTGEAQTKQLSNTLAQVRGELASALKNYKSSNANELGAKLQLREQAKLASECQEKYERELVLHAKDVESLTLAKDEHQRLSSIVGELEERAKTSEHKLEEYQSSWQKQKDDQSKEMKKMESRCADLVDQNSILHQQVQKLTTEITEARKRPLESIVIPATSASGSGDEGAQEGEGKSVEELWEIIRFVRREKEIAETKCELSQQESVRFQQRCEYIEKQLEEARANLSEEKTHSELEVETTAQHAEILEKVEKLNELTENNKILTEEKNKLEQKVKSVETKVQKVESELQPLRESNRTVTAQKDSLLAEKTALKNEIMRWSARTNQLLEQYRNVDADEYRRMTEEKKQFQQQIAALKTENQRSKSQLELLRTEMSRTQGELSSLKSEYQKNQEQYKEQTEASKAGHTGEINKAKEEIEALKKTVEEKTNDISEKIKTLNQVKKIARKYKSQFDEQSTELQEMKKVTEQGKQIREPSQASAADAAPVPTAVDETKVKELNNKIENLESEVKTLKEKDEQNKNVIKEKEEKNKKVLIQVREKLNQYSSLKDRLTTLTTENEALKKTVQSAKAEYESVQQHNTELDMRLRVLSTQYEGKLLRLENENKELKEFKESREKKAKEEQEQKQKLLEQQERLQSEMDQMQQKVQQQQLHIQQQQKKLSTLTAGATATPPRLPAAETTEGAPVQEDTTAVITTMAPTSAVPPTATIKPTPTTASTAIKPLVTPTASIRPMAISQTQPTPARTATVLPTVSPVASTTPALTVATHQIPTTVSVRPITSAVPLATSAVTDVVQSVVAVTSEALTAGPSQEPSEPTTSAPPGKRPREDDEGILESEAATGDRQEGGEQPLVKKIRTSEEALVETSEPGVGTENEDQEREDEEILEEEADEEVEEMGEDYFEDEEEPEEEGELDEGVSEVPDVDKAQQQGQTIPEVVLIDSDDDEEEADQQEEEEEDEEEEEYEEYEEEEEEEEGDMDEEYDDEEEEGEEEENQRDENVVEVIDDDEDEAEPEEENLEEDIDEAEEEEGIEGEGEDEEGGEGAEVEEGNEDEDLDESTVDDDIQGVADIEDRSQEPDGSSRDNVPDVDQLQRAGVPTRGQSATVVSVPVTQSMQQEDISTRRAVGPGPLMSDRPRLHSVRGHLAPFSFPPGVHSSGSAQFDDLEDCTVPSTPTLFVPKRTDGFAEALSSPQIHRPFSFVPPGESMSQGGGLESSISEEGLRVDDTHMDFLMEETAEESAADRQSYTVPTATAIEPESDIHTITSASRDLPSQGSLESLESESEFPATDISGAATVPQVSSVPAITVTLATAVPAVVEISDDAAEQNVPVVQESLEQEVAAQLTGEEEGDEVKHSVQGDDGTVARDSEGSQETSRTLQESGPLGGQDPTRPKGTVVQLRRPGTGTSSTWSGAGHRGEQQRGSLHPHAGRARRIKRIPPGRGTSRGSGFHPRGRGAPGGRM